jgi:hypothetical protein
MAILGIFTGNNITKKMYEDARKEVDWEHKYPAGLILHAASFDDSGNNMHVADVWDSEQDLNNFVSSRLKPGLERINVPMPKAEIFSIHNVNVYPSTDKYRVT